jgi:hypothetical protein
MFTVEGHTGIVVDCVRVGNAEVAVEGRVSLFGLGRLFDLRKWKNQYGVGFVLEVNFYILGFSLEFDFMPDRIQIEDDDFDHEHPCNCPDNSKQSECCDNEDEG